MKVLQIFYDVSSNNSEKMKIFNLYEEAMKKRNDEVANNPFCDSGFDLFVETNYEEDNNQNLCKIDYKIKCAMFDEETNKPCAYFLCPRSSIYKYDMVQCNGFGVIDSGYRGNICAMFYKQNKERLSIPATSRLNQICLPSLEPFKVQLVTSQELLGETIRGSGGFGSTGQ
jgi:dUTP pyrophosphatase